MLKAYALIIISIAVITMMQFQREFDYATGRKQRTVEVSSTPPASKPLANNAQPKAAAPSNTASPRMGGADRPQAFDSELKSRLNKLDLNNSTAEPAQKQQHQPQTQLQQQQQMHTAKKSWESVNQEQVSSSNRLAGQFQPSAKKIEKSATDFTAGTASSEAALKAAEDAKTISQLKNKIKDLEMHNITLTADNAALQETIAAQSKNISSLNQQIESIQGDLDKLRAGFQQNATSASLWKQKLEDYQQSNDALTLKIQQLRELYAKFGEILRPN